MKQNKTDRYLNLLLEIANTSGWVISESKLIELLGTPSKSQFYLYLSELTEGNADRPPLLERIKTDTSTTYKLHHQTWKSFYEAIQEGDFILEAHKKLGHLLDSDYVDGHFQFESSTKNIERKFFYLSKIQAVPKDAKAKKIFKEIVKAVIGSNKIFIKYSHKTYDLFPISICQYRDDLYLIAFKDSICDENLRTFKICRIEQTMESIESFVYPSQKKWNPLERYHKTSGLIVGDEQTAKIRFFGHARLLMSERSFFSNKLVQQTHEFDEYECIYTSENELLGQLFCYADEMQILAPQSLKESFANKAEKALVLNQQKIKKVS